MTTADLLALAAAWQPRNDGVTHWDGCERVHPSCMIARLAAALRAAEAERAALRAELREIGAALGDPADNNIATTAECVARLRAENERLRTDALSLRPFGDILGHNYWLDAISIQTLWRRMRDAALTVLPAYWEQRKQVESIVSDLDLQQRVRVAVEAERDALRAENERLRALLAEAQPRALVRWDGGPHAATDTVWIEPGRALAAEEKK